ncbi:hypothetical protein FACS189496_3000 [Bacilli bacterium]|nr:hypothetical protein FACS189496_3000 [Bacilli bacterium]
MAILCSDIMATTIAQVDKDIADNIKNSNPFMRHLKTHNKIKRPEGGKWLEHTVLCKPNKNGSWYKGAGYLRTGNNDQFKDARYDWRLYNMNVAITGEDEMKNKGAQWMQRDLVQEKLEAAKTSAINEVAAAMWDNTLVGDEEHLSLTSISEIVSNKELHDDDEYAGILERSWTPLAGIVPDYDNKDPNENGLFWCNYVARTNKTNFLKAMEFMYMALSRNNQKPDIIVCHPKVYFAFEDLMFNNKRFVETRSTNADPSFPSIAFKTIPVFFDSGCPADTMFMLNTSYLFFQVHADRFFNYEPKKQAPAQDVTLFPLYFMGNFTCSGRQFQGRIEVDGI